MIATMPNLLSGDTPLEPIVREKSIPTGSIHPSKIKVCVVRK
jgi:hypothetical protein